MERSAIQHLARRGQSIRQIARELGRSPTTIARVLREPLDRLPVARRRCSKADPYRPQIEQWVRAGLTAARMLELARTAPEAPYPGGHSVFRALVRRVRLEQQHQQAGAAVPVRFEGLPGEYLQVDWGEVRRFPFTQAPRATRYFLACRLKYSRWGWVRFTTEMRQETLFRGLVDCFMALGWVPWVLVFDNMKTVTSGRDAAQEPIWTPALRQLAAEFGFHPQACSPHAGNQKGAVESLVKWVKGNCLAGRTFLDDADLAAQATDWREQTHRRPSAATGEPPLARLPQEAAQGGALPATAHDYGLLTLGQVSAEALVAVHGNRYSVPVAHVGLAVTSCLHRERVRLWRHTECVADHPRALDGAHQRVIDVAHFAPLFRRKPRAQVMLYRDALLGLSPLAEPFLSELSRRHRAQLGPQVLAVYALYQEFGASELLAAMALAHQAGTCSAEALALLLARPVGPPAVQPLVLPGVPSQAAIDRPLSHYEALVYVEVGTPAALAEEGVR
ncbi:MAG: IS21 family transposase [Geminicoccaceae bacterium]